ncbi:CAAX amino terminal protease self- immunity [Actinoalloteichus hoggarensis]|uniref:CAAX amino terminal protease self-immunity n=2 Tax=Actinoalloteichus hoggarensis TaxID=1470176 RepID=A0A221W171_9PSEU|nr:CAAX amino terminal protease self- immunity [Actinoalloteichus hoggarensis]
MAALLTAGTVSGNVLLPPKAYPVGGLSATVAALCVARRCGLSRDDIGMGPDSVSAGLRVGGAATAAISAVGLAALAVPTLRRAFEDDRAADAGVGELLWNVLIRIPVGTVLLEEVAFRGVLPALTGARTGHPTRAMILSAGMFGLWHVLPALRLAGDNRAVEAAVGHGRLPTVLAGVSSTFVVGLALHALRVRGRGVLAPALVHLATNSGGYLVSWLVQRAARRRRAPV